MNLAHPLQSGMTIGARVDALLTDQIVLYPSEWLIFLEFLRLLGRAEALGARLIRDQK
jgi:hypothetical protein